MSKLRTLYDHPVHGRSAEELSGAMVASGGGATNNLVINVIIINDGSNAKSMGEKVADIVAQKLNDLWGQK